MFYPHRETKFEEVKNQSFRGSFYLDDIYESMLIYAQTIKNMTTPGNLTSIDSLRGCDIVQNMMGKRYKGK